MFGNFGGRKQRSRLITLGIAEINPVFLGRPDLFHWLQSMMLQLFKFGVDNRMIDLAGKFDRSDLPTLDKDNIPRVGQSAFAGADISPARLCYRSSRL